MPNHIARVIDKETNPEDEKFGPQNQVEDLGPNGIAFSVICCESEKTITRHTLSHAHLLSAEGRQRLMELICQDQAEEHMKSRMAIEHIRSMRNGSGVSVTVEHPEL